MRDADRRQRPAALVLALLGVVLAHRITEKMATTRLFDFRIHSALKRARGGWLVRFTEAMDARSGAVWVIYLKKGRWWLPARNIA
jgi:hypothetical protein